VELLPDQRIDGILDAAARVGLWGEALDLLGSLSPEQRRLFAEHAGGRDPAELDSLIEAARELDLWAPLLPLVSFLPPDAQERAAESVRRLGLSPSERERVLEHVRAEGLIDDLGPVGRALSGE